MEWGYYEPSWVFPHFQYNGKDPRYQVFFCFKNEKFWVIPRKHINFTVQQVWKPNNTTFAYDPSDSIQCIKVDTL